MSKLNLMDEIQGMDVENFETVASEALDFESMMAMEIEEAEFQAQAEETQEAVEAFEEASEIAVEVQEEIQETLENIDEMTPVAVGKALGAIAEKASELVDVAETAVDAEAMDADFKAGARLELEAISDSIKKAWEAVKNFFRSVWAKIKQLIHNVGLWVVNGKKKTEKAKELLDKKKEELKTELSADKQEELAVKTIKAIGMWAEQFGKSEIESWIGTLTNMGTGDKVSTQFESMVKTEGTSLKGVPALGSDTTLKVVRIDGSTVAAVILKKFDGVIGYHQYIKVSLGAWENKYLKAKAAKSARENLANAKKIYEGALESLLVADAVHSRLKGIKEALYKEMSDVGRQVDGDVEKVKFDQGFFKMVWSSTLGKKSVEQLEAQEKVRLVRNRASFTSKYTFDVLYGLNGLANGYTRVALLLTNLLKDK